MASKVSSSHLTSHTDIITSYTEQNKPMAVQENYTVITLPY